MWKMPFVGRLVLALAEWSARNVRATVGMPCGDMLRLVLDNFAFFAWYMVRVLVHGQGGWYGEGAVWQLGFGNGIIVTVT